MKKFLVLLISLFLGLPTFAIVENNAQLTKSQMKYQLKIEKELENSDGYAVLKASPRKVVRHYEPELYEEFFNQVSKNLFVAKGLN